MKTITHHRRKRLLLLWAFVLACGPFTSLAQSPLSLLIDFSTDSRLRLSWTNTSGNIVLEETDTLTPITVWQPFPENPTLANGQFSVVLDITDFSRFFRLHRIETNGLPPDAAAVASPLPTGLAMPLAEATAFLYAGPNPIQTGVANGTIEARRAAVLRGKVKERNNTPLAGVTISILNHPELGQTLSRADGVFDLAVNGGGLLTVKYEKTGFCPVQRQINVPWQDYMLAQDVVMIQMDPIVTSVALGPDSPMQVHQGSVQTDADGSRRATLLFTPGTCGNLVLANGTTQSCSGISVRATEFTVGANGPAAMPAVLPATSAYTYCVELSADEAMAQGATDIQFDRPVCMYVENFLGFPAGTDVPLGSYDRRRGVWIPEKNGKVIKILSVTGGLANLDTDGDELGDSAASLAALSITDAERERLAALYEPGQSLWRLLVTHFTPYDPNWPFVPPDDAVLPADDPEPDDPLDNCCELSGNSVIETENQVLGEAIGVVGTSFALHYRSDRAPGYQAAYTLEIPLSDANLPASVESIELEIEIAGRRFEQSFPAIPNQRTTFTWDGKDVYGRTLHGPQPITVNISYIYPAVYSQTQRFGATGTGLVTPVRARQQYQFRRVAPVFIGTWRAPTAGLGGWTLSPHHVYVPATKVLFRGDGRRESLTALGPTIETVAGGASTASSGNGGAAVNARFSAAVRGVAAGPDGSLYIVDALAFAVRRIGPDGIISKVAGGAVCVSGPCGDGGPATQAAFSNGGMSGVAVGPDHSLYIVDSAISRVRKVTPDGIITTFAGTGIRGFSGDGGPATQAQLDSPAGVAVGIDNAVYVSDGPRIRRIGPDGIITTFAGTGVRTFSGDGGPATVANLQNPRGIAVGRDGSLYIADVGHLRIRRITPDGIIRTIAGTGEKGFSGDGGPATQARFDSPTGLAVGPDDSVYVVDAGNNRIRWFRPGGVVHTIAGNGVAGTSGDGGPAARASVHDVGIGIAVGPDGGVYFAQAGNFQTGQTDPRVRRVAPVGGGELVVAGELFVPANDGSEVFVFTPEGRHLRTLDGLTGALRYQFGHDAAGQLASITDGSGNVTTIERDGNGLPTGILSPFGQHTTLQVNANGYLSQVTNPAGEAVQLGYTPGGLLAAFTKPGGQTSSYGYDPLGRLVTATDPTGATKTLARSGSNKDHTVKVTSALGRVSTFRAARASNQDLHLTTTDPAGAQSQLLIAQNGNQSKTNKDGTTVIMQLGPDPRWGMRAPIPTNITVKMPNGLTLTSTVQRAVTLASPGAFLDLSNLTDTATANGRTFTTTYSASTRTLTYTSPTGRQQKLVLDNLGRVMQGQLGDMEPTSFTYDARGRFAGLTAGTAANSRTTAFAYGPNGFLASITDAFGRTSILTNDPVGRITGVTRPGGTIVGSDYDANGNVLSITPPGRPSHLFTSTARDETSSYTAPVVGTENSKAVLTYDADRLPVHVVTPNGETNAWQYDRAGRLGLGTLPSGERTYGYDAANRLISLSTSQGINLTRTYEGWLGTGTTWSGAVPGSVTQTYDNDFRVSELNVNGANPISIQYDKDGLPVQVGSLVLTREPQIGLVTATTLGALSDAATYNGFGELASYAASHDSTVLYSATYSRDQLGRVTSKNETIDGTTHLFDYTYDFDGRLTQVRQDNALIAKYTYDANGNRTSFTGDTGAGTLSASYDAQDRLTQYGATSYAYTPNGELLRKTAAAQMTTYDYDGASKLAGLTLPDGKRIDYLLDGRARRMGKKVNGVLVQAFLYQDGLRPIAELDSTTAVVSRFVYAGSENVPAYMIKGRAIYRIITDQIGSPRLVIDVATGQIMQRMDYDEFGLVTLDTNPSFQPFGFAGGLYDPLSGLVHFGAREYDAEIGRWTVKDPSGLSSGPNVYAYANNDPVNFIDTLGYGPEKILPRGYYAPQWNPGTPPAPPPPPPPAPPPSPVAPPVDPLPAPPPAAPPTPRTFDIIAPNNDPSRPLEIIEYGTPAEPAAPAPAAQCERVGRFARLGRVFRVGGPVLAFLGGVFEGRQLDEQFNLSGQAADVGIQVKEAYLAAGLPQQDADLMGGLTSFVVGAGAGAAFVVIPSIPFLDDD